MMRIAVIAAALALATLPATSAAAADAVPAKGYLVAEITVTNPVAYEDYKKVVGPMILAHGGRYLVRGDRVEPLEGPAPSGRVVVVEFPTYAKARAFYDSPEYQAILRLRTDNATSRIYVTEGFVP